MKLSHRDAIAVQLGLFAQALAITLDKRADYANKEDPYSNFRYGNDILGVPDWKRPMARNLEKFSRRANIMENGGLTRAQDDPFVDAARDSINLVHIEFGLELEVLGEGGTWLKRMYKDAEELPALVSQFLALTRGAEIEDIEAVEE